MERTKQAMRLGGALLGLRIVFDMIFVAGVYLLTLGGLT